METSAARPLALAQLIGACVVALAGAVAGGLMQVELLDPGPRWSAPFYSRMLMLHGSMPLAVGSAALAGGLGYLAIGRLLGARRLPAPALGWLGFGAWVIGVACWWFASQLDHGWTMYAPESLGRPVIVYLGPLLVALASVIYALHLGLVVVAHRAADLATALAVILVIALAGAGFLGLRDTFATLPPAYPSIAAFIFALGLATMAVTGGHQKSRIVAVVTLGTIALWAVIPHAVLALAIGGLWIALAIMGGFGRLAVAFVVFGCAPALALHGFANGLLSVADVPLADTHFAIGVFHLQMIAAGFALLAGVHAWPAIARRPHPTLLWLGACTTSTGMILHVIGSLIVGRSGMPRRYWQYDPELVSHHGIGGWGAVIAVAGLVVIAVAWIAGRSAHEAHDAGE